MPGVLSCQEETRLLPSERHQRNKGVVSLKNVYRIKSSERPPFQWQLVRQGEPSHRLSLHLSRGHSRSLAKFPTMHSSCCLPSSRRLPVAGWSHLFPAPSAFCGSLIHECQATGGKRSGPLLCAQCCGEAEAALSDKICPQDSSGCFSTCW